jgi:hypothetical protein
VALAPLEICRPIDILSRDGAKVIGFDVIFSEPDENSQLALIDQFTGAPDALAIRDPRLHALPVAVLERHDLLGAVGAAHPDHDQRAEPLLLQADGEAHAIGPQIDVVALGQVPLPERCVLGARLFVRRRIALDDRPTASGPSRAGNASRKSPDERPCKYSSGRTLSTRGDRRT